jgi:hypothetical protein
MSVLRGVPYIPTWCVEPRPRLCSRANALGPVEQEVHSIPTNIVSACVHLRVQGRLRMDSVEFVVVTRHDGKDVRDVGSGPDHTELGVHALRQ